MKSFNMLFKLEMTLLKNNVLSIVKNPKRIITYVIYIAFMTWVILSNTKNFSESSMNFDSFYSYASGGVFIMLFMMGYGLTTKSSIYFKRSEINILFTSPIDQRKILMFALLKRIPVYLLTSLYTLIFLLSIVINLYHPTMGELIITCFGYTMVFLVLEPLGFCIFAIGTKLQRTDVNQRFLKVIFAVIAAIAVIQVALAVRDQGLNVATVMGGLGSENLNWLPIIGWGKQLTLTALYGITPLSYVYLALMVGLYLTLVLLTYFLGDDYYEDVIQTSEERDVIIKKARSGKMQFSGFHFKKKKIKAKDTQKYAGAIYWKRKLITMKTDISVFFSMETILCLVLGAGSSFLINGEAQPYSAVIVTGIYFYMKFLFSMNTALDQELKMHYYYTLPDTAINKMISVTKLDLIKFFINIMVLVVSNIIISQHISLTLVILPFAATMFYTMMMMSSFLMKLFFSTEDFNRLLIMFKMLQMIIVLLPSIITMIILGILTESIFFALLGSFIVNLILTTVILGMSDVLFNRLELK